MKGTVVILMVLMSTTVFAQETIFSVMQGPAKLGDQAFEKGDYKTAIEYYGSSLDKDPDNVRILSKLAECYYSLKDHLRAIATYDALTRRGKTLTSHEMFNYAEAQSSIGNYSVAITYYKKCLQADRQNELISKKVWALSNINFLREDSAHYHIKPVTAVNTRASEMGATLYNDAIVFTSNRKGTRPLDLATDAAAGPFYELYIVEWKVDSASKEKTFSRPSHFAKSLGMSYNAGPVAFYNHRKNMVLVASSAKTGDDGNRPLGLYFAELKDSKWKVTSSWVHNSDIYSITDVAINDDGNRIYFSSNMRGGAGGKDIYTSVMTDGIWSKPVNLGEGINTKGDEVFPYLHRNGTLYFSSDGLPGIGGLDIFQSTIRTNGYSEPENVGYPVNSSGDDFGLTFDSLATHGYFSSNRINGGLDDDIYEFGMDLQTYPFQMTGVLKFKDHTWSDTLDIHVWSNAELSLIDTWQNTEVEKTTSGEDGTFTLTIPYFSRYHIRVVDDKGHEHKASLELEKYRTEAFRYEIVVVKDLFADLKDEGQK